MRFVVFLIGQLFFAYFARPAERDWTVVFLIHLKLKFQCQLGLFQSFPFRFLLLVVLFLRLFVIESVSMLCVEFLALKALSASCALELVGF